MTDDPTDRIIEINAACDEIKTCEDLTAYVDSLVEAVEDGVFEYHDVKSYLDGVSSVLFGMRQSAPETSDWKLFGHILTAAFFR